MTAPADIGWLDGVEVRCRTYDCKVVSSTSGKQVTDDCPICGRVNHLSTNTKLNSTFTPTRVGKSTTDLSGWDCAGARLPVSGVS